MQNIDTKIINLFLDYFYIWFFLFFIIWAIYNDLKDRKSEKYFSEWEKIRQKAFDFYGRYCSDCGIWEHLQVHHKIPKSMGGSDDISNLIILCKDCHEKEHGYKFDDTQINLGKIASIKMKRINEAISKNEKLTIIYNNTFKGEMIKREIMPVELYKGEYKTKTGKVGYHWTIRAFCYLRNGERHFQLRKIKDIL